MKIKYKGLIKDRFQDAPFVGTLIVACDCKFNCKGCFHKHLINDQSLIIQKDSREIISIIKNNPFNQGIILGGLEWSLQSDEAYALVSEAVKNNLKVMIYTGIETKEEVFEKMPWIRNFKGIYVKIGRFLENNTEREVFGVRLASKNQNIFQI